MSVALDVLREQAPVYRSMNRFITAGGMHIKPLCFISRMRISGLFLLAKFHEWRKPVPRPRCCLVVFELAYNQIFDISGYGETNKASTFP